jgi:hypothetical protein
MKNTIDIKSVSAMGFSTEIAHLKVFVRECELTVEAKRNVITSPD